ncbi:MAG: hypothetical protein IKO91_00760 [Oscillospiraceae bacterium]|nr:hypothetical protein [Oscillospiraceae bacterium]
MNELMMMDESMFSLQPVVAMDGLMDTASSAFRGAAKIGSFIQENKEELKTGAKYVGVGLAGAAGGVVLAHNIVKNNPDLSDASKAFISVGLPVGVGLLVDFGLLALENRV